jgi:predicted TPR repeat methyltransferase
MADVYDEWAEATGWRGPQVAFGLAFRYVRPGESILDLGIGTGLSSELFRKAGLQVSGMDVSREMLDACRAKGFTDLARHDLSEPPYPYASGSFDHAVCLGVLNLIRDLSPVIGEVARLLRGNGVFVFVVLDRGDAEPPELALGPEYTGEAEPVDVYRHSPGQIRGWLAECGFTPTDDFAFTVPMDPERLHGLPARAYLARMV